ncbi:MAG: hypothetical protein AAGG72_06885 [Pseudomonadota bacterium]
MNYASFAERDWIDRNFGEPSADEIHRLNERDALIPEVKLLAKQLHDRLRAMEAVGVTGFDVPDSERGRRVGYDLEDLVGTLVDMASNDAKFDGEE